MVFFEFILLDIAVPGCRRNAIGDGPTVMTIAVLHGGVSLIFKKGGFFFLPG